MPLINLATVLGAATTQAISFESTLIVQLISTGILIYLIKKTLWKGFADSINARKDFINGNIDETKNRLKEAQELESELKAEKLNLNQKQHEILATTHDIANKEKEEIIANSKEHARNIIKKSQEEADSYVSRAQVEIQREMLEHINAVAGQFISQKINDDEELKMIEKTIGMLADEK